MLSKFLDPKNDVAFKKIFGTEQNKDILIHFLNDIITFREGGKVKDVTFLKTNMDPEAYGYKASIVDILCKDNEGRSYVVEMQVARAKGFEKRAQFYAAKTYISQIYEGGKYENLKEVIFLAISDYVMFPQKTAYKSDHFLLDKVTFEHDLKDFSFTFLELGKFDKKIEDLNNMTEKWAYFLKHAEETSAEDFKKLTFHDAVMERAYHELERWSWTPQELQTYESAEKNERDFHAINDQKFYEGEQSGIKKGIEEGQKIGIEKGEKIGIEKGETIGIEKGERIKAIKIAQSMMEKGMDIETIKEFTGLTEEEFDSLSDLMPVLIRFL